VFALALIIWNVLRIYPGDRWLLVRLGNYFAPWLFMALVPALVVALLARRPWLTRVALLLGLVFLVRYWPLLFPRLPQLNAGNSANELRVMTFNVNYANRNASDIADLIRAESPDVIAMQELKEGLAVPLQAELASEYPYFLYDSGQGLTGLISRYPLTAGSTLPELRYSWRANVETPEGTVTVWSVHLATALSQRGWEVQRKMAAALAQEAEKEARPMVVMGDFNTTDQTENYRLVADRLNDVHWSVARGFGFTFPDLRRYGTDSPLLGPVVRIDHIFVSDHFAPLEIHVISSGHGSDHRPVVATLRVNSR
jgi:vancomycin resistance protein VanJ